MRCPFTHGPKVNTTVGTAGSKLFSRDVLRNVMKKVIQRLFTKVGVYQQISCILLLLTDNRMKF